MKGLRLSKEYKVALFGILVVAFTILLLTNAAAPLGAAAVAGTLLGLGLSTGLSRGVRARQMAAEVQKDHLLKLTLDNMSQGLCMFDASQKILVSNERYRAIYSLPDELVKPGITLREILAYRRTNGGYQGPPAEEY